MSRQRMYCQVYFLLIFTILMLLLNTRAEAKQGFYLGFGAAYNTIQGDFDGTSGLQGGTEEIILPNFDSAAGIDILAGYGINDVWAVELNIMTSSHRGSWSGNSGDARYSSISINGKYDLAPSRTVQPFFLFGISNNVLLIKNGAQDTGAGEVGDATLTGFGLNAGLGLDEYLSPEVSLTQGIIYRYVDYTRAKGVHKNGKIEGGTNGSGFSFLLTGAYHF